MDLGSLIILFGIIIIAIQFWRIRANAEYMVQFANQYCKRHQLQYISLARTGTKFTAYKGRLDWQLKYELAFSSDGETEYIGEMLSHGKQVINIDLPAYKINTDRQE